MYQENNSTIKVVLISVILSIIIAIIICVSGFVLYHQFISNTVTEKVITTSNLVEEESAVISAVETAGPAVVSIVISQEVPVFEEYYDEPTGDPFFSPFFMQPQYKQQGTELQEVGAGSGFIVSDDGYIVTNKHVVSEVDAEYTVFLQNGEKYTAQVLAKDPVNDLAILKIEATDLPTLELGDSSTLKPGQTAIAIGYALGEFKNTVSKGVISGLGRSITTSDAYGQTTEELENIIQTDAAINQGNSGGPLLNINGQVIGINVAMSMEGENIAFAIAINDAKKAINDVKENGRIIRAYLGVRYIPINKQIQENNQLDVDYGVLVARGEDVSELAVIPGSPADKAGIEENDIILEVDSKKIDIDNELKKYLSKKSVGDKIILKVLHDGDEKDVEVILEEWKS